MEYSFRSESVAQALPEVRARFIRRTYEHLALALLALLGLEYVLFTSLGPERLASIAGLMTRGFNWLLVLGLFMVVSWIADRMARSSVSRGVQYAGLALYTVAQAVILLPLLVIAIYFVGDQTLVPTAALITGVLFLGLTVVAFTTRTDFSFLRSILIIGGFVALGLIAASVIFGFTLGLIFSVVMVGFASAAILYYTSNIIRYYNTDQYVAASLTLFASVALMFFYILQILISLRNQ